MNARTLWLSGLTLALLTAGPTVANADPLDPGAYASLGALPAGSFAIDTDLLTYDGLPGGVVQPQAGGPDIAVFVFDGGSVLAAGDVITVAGSRPVALLFQGDATLGGTIDVSGADGGAQILINPATGTHQSGPGGGGGSGGGDGGRGANGFGLLVGDPGQGPGGGGGSSSVGGGAAPSGGGGGGFGGDGRDGGLGSIPGAGGVAYGDLRTALEGGSGGGGAGAFCCVGLRNNAGGGGGGGGGGLEIGATTALDFLGATILAVGGDGGSPGSPGGGGSGGGVLLHAFDVRLDAATAVDASGGEGSPQSGAGCGGGGRVLIGTNSAGQLVNLAGIDVSGGLSCDSGVFETFAAPDIGTPSNQPPVAVCQDATAVADAGCLADAIVDAGSFDPDGDPITRSQAPPGPYALGDTLVELTVTDDSGASATCQATVTVVDLAAPVVQCNAPATIVPPDAPISFAATAADNCGVDHVLVTGFDCFAFTKKGKRIDKTESCRVELSGGVITILDSGGVGDRIVWEVTATDASGNATTEQCGVEVVNPGHGG